MQLIADDPEVRRCLEALREAGLSGLTLDDQVGAVRLAIERRKNPDLRLEACVLDFIGHWSLQPGTKQPKTTRGWWAAWRNWCNCAVKFGNWYAVPSGGKPGQHMEAGERRVDGVQPSARNVPSPASRPLPAASSREPVGISEVARAELDRLKAMFQGED